jgi:hypothetical protein
VEGSNVRPTRCSPNAAPRNTPRATAYRVVGVVAGIDEVVEPPGVDVDEVPDREVGVRESGMDVVVVDVDVDEVDLDDVDVDFLGTVVVARGVGRVGVVGRSGVVGVVMVGGVAGTALRGDTDAGRTRTYATRVRAKTAPNTAVEVRMRRRIRSGAPRWSPALRAG